MKHLGTILIILSVFLLSSCDSTKRKDVLGSWKIAEGSTEQQKLRILLTKDRIITEFKLKADSTATIFYGKEVQEGTWIWSDDETSGKESDGITISFRIGDVVLLSKDKEGKASAFGLNLENKNGKSNLKSLGTSLDTDDFSYVKQ